ncbi:MAG: WD40-like protein beta propeller containing protein [uncultured bacterium]|nr:MAG: WD40-like protein beta propeller containing protein [uncultured bacterium]HBY00963.1 hypothetical protein [Rikenellaceae bacterium]
MNRPIFLLLIIMLAGSLAEVRAQNNSQKYLKAEELRRSYKFNEAIALYKELLSESQDTIFLKTLTVQIARSENGISMLEYAGKPVSLGAITVPKKDFYLSIPGLQDSSWTIVPDLLDRKAAESEPINAVLLKGGKDKIIYSSINSGGRLDLYQTSKTGSSWSIPEPLNKNVNSAGDEILPILSSDGKELYFASNGQYGMGGFDIYVSTWDEKRNDWGIPQNLGFPYSSPGDDLMYINSDNRDFSFVVSNRDIASSDSVKIYKLRFDGTPVKSAITSAEEAYDISGLLPEGTKREEYSGRNIQSMTSPYADGYSSIVKNLRELQTEIDKTVSENNRIRELYAASTDASARSSLEKQITLAEIRLIEQQEQLRTVNQTIQTKELEFLSKGLIAPRSEDFLKDTKQSDSTAKDSSFEFVKRSFGPTLLINIQKPVVTFDNTFRIESESQIAEDNPNPNELIYRIQISVQTQKANKKSFKGINPIFERKTPTGKWLYSAGQFYNYGDMSNALVKVKNQGFRTAMGTAFYNGKSITIKNARLMETQITENKIYQLKLENYPEGIPPFLLDVIRKNTDKDIASKTTGSVLLFYIGPFTNKKEAETLLKLLSESGAERVSLEEIKAQ